MTQPNVDFRSELAGQATALRSLAARLVSKDAEDLTHDAMVTALTAPTPPRRVRPWLRQVLRNEARARRRSTLRRQAREQWALTFDDAALPDVAAEHAQMAAAVQDALVGLAPAYRRVLEARFWDDRTAADIARSEGCPAGTVRWRVQEGLRRMRSALDVRFEGREAWRDRMAAFAAAPLALAGRPPGEPTMITSPLFTKLAIGALVTAAVAGTAVVATSDSSTDAIERASDAPLMAAVTRTPASESRREMRTSAQRPIDAVPRPQPPETDPGCETCTAAGMPFFDAVALCQSQHTVSEDGRIDVHVELNGMRVESATVRSRHDADFELASCLREALPGSEATQTAEGEMPEAMNLALLPETADVPQDIEASTPAEMADEGLLPVRAQGDAPVRTIVACSDYDCPFCERARSTLDQVLDEFADVELAWMHAPMEPHPGALVAARAAVAAQAQGKFWEMHALLFDRVDARSDDDMLSFAEELGLDLARFERDFESEATAQAVAEQAESCRAAGAKGVPSFFVGDRVMIGAQGVEAFRDLLE